MFCPSSPACHVPLSPLLHRLMYPFQSSTLNHHPMYPLPATLSPSLLIVLTCMFPNPSALISLVFTFSLSLSWLYTVPLTFIFSLLVFLSHVFAASSSLSPVPIVCLSRGASFIKGNNGSCFCKSKERIIVFPEVMLQPLMLQRLIGN